MIYDRNMNTHHFILKKDISDELEQIDEVVHFQAN